jgi:hypothetical protein
MQNVGDPEGRQVSVVADYKRDGACPYVDQHDVTFPPKLAGWKPSPDNWEIQPVPKMTCEEFWEDTRLPTAAGDPCTYMEDDRLYVVTSCQAGDIASTERLFALEGKIK